MKNILKGINNYLWVAIISVILGMIVKYISFFTPNSPEYPILFSTIATILASILALIFLVLTIFIQISNRYSSFELLINRESKILMLTYFITIITCLFMIMGGYYVPTLIFVLATFCLMSLYPFLYNINNSILYGLGIQDLSDQIAEAIDSRNLVMAAHRIEDLGLIGKKAMKTSSETPIERIIHTYELALQSASHIGGNVVLETVCDQYIYLIEHSTQNNKPEIIEDLLNKIYNYMDLFAVKISSIKVTEQLSKIKNLGFRFIKDGYEEPYVTLTIKILFVSLSKATYGLGKDDDNPIIYLEELAKASYNKSLNSSFETAVMGLWAYALISHNNKILEENRLITRSSSLKSIEVLFGKILSSINSVEILCGRNEIEKIYNQFLKSPKTLSDDLADFHNISDEVKAQYQLLYKEK